MEEFKGTPGPWHVSNEGKLIIRDNELFSHVAWAGYANNDEEFATARLIASAPELLEALQELISSYDDFRTRKGNPEIPQANEIIKARAAIAKALGKEYLWKSY